MPSYSRKATGTIAPYTFVSLDTANLGQVVQSIAGGEVYGVSAPGTRRVPYDGLDDGNAAIAGENVNIFGPPEKDVLVRLGGTVAIGAFLSSDATGRAVTAAATLGTQVGGIALRGGVIDDLVPIQLTTFSL